MASEPSLTENRNTISNSIWQIDQEDWLVDNSIVLKEPVEFRSNYGTSLSGIDTFTLETQGKDMFYDYHNAYLEYSCQIDKGKGSTGLTDINIALVNCSASLWDNAELYLDNAKVERQEFPGTSVLMRTLVEETKERMDTVGPAEFWYPDSHPQGPEFYNDGATGGVLSTTTASGSSPLTTGNIADNDASGWYPRGDDKKIQFFKANNADKDMSNIRENPHYNPGYVERLQRCMTVTGQSGATSVNVKLRLSDLFGFLRSYKKAMRGPRLQVKLVRNRDPGRLLYGDFGTGRKISVAPKVELTKLVLMVPEVQPNYQTMSMLSEKLASGAQVRHLYAHSELFYRNSLTPSTGENNYLLPTSPSRPLRAYIGFKSVNRRLHISTNYQQFDAFDLESITMKVNGVQYPRENMSLNLSDKSQRDVIRALEALHQCGAKAGGDNGGALVDYKTWTQTYPIFCIDMEHMAIDTLLKNRSSVLDLRWKFRTAPSTDYDLFILLQSEKEVRLDLISSAVRVRS